MANIRLQEEHFTPPTLVFQPEIKFSLYHTSQSIFIIPIRTKSRWDMKINVKMYEPSFSIRDSDVSKTKLDEQSEKIKSFSKTT